MLLQWFALPEDRGIFEALESGEQLECADIAHAYLRGRLPDVRFHR